MLELLKQPAYTGQNRCIPCTVLNLSIVLVTAGLLRGVSEVVAVLVVIGGVIAIYLRGYLVPGTPKLTQRVFPDRVLSWFGKSPTAAPGDMDGTAVELVLLEAGALEACDEGTELCLNREFRRVWRRELRKLPGLSSFPVETMVGMEYASRTDIEKRASTVVLTTDDQVAGWWPSHAAFRADGAAAISLSERYYGWASLDFRDRTAVLAGLRLWLDTCPDCGNPLELGTEVVDSCCSTRDVVAVTCTGCDARIIEAPQNE